MQVDHFKFEWQAALITLHKYKCTCIVIIRTTGTKRININ